jgi:hypothetical protein
MREIVSGCLWLGNAADVRDPRRLLGAGVEAVVDLAYEESPAALPRTMLYCRFPVVDGAGNRPQLLVTAIESTVGLVSRQIPTLVGCGAGMSRSPAILAAVLAIVRGQSPETCLQELLTAVPHDVSPTLWADVKIAYKELAEVTRRVGK